MPQDKVFGDVAAFGDQWWKWWSLINPSWRERDAEGRIVVGGAGEGNFVILQKPGACGMLSVLMCLLWWYERLEADEVSSSWDAAVEDVEWVIKELEEENRCDF